MKTVIEALKNEKKKKTYANSSHEKKTTITITSICFKTASLKENLIFHFHAKNVVKVKKRISYTKNSA